jgi:hypothetical protein
MVVVVYGVIQRMRPLYVTHVHYQVYHDHVMLLIVIRLHVTTMANAKTMVHVIASPIIMVSDVTCTLLMYYISIQTTLL